jgi:DNA-binding MarR family transcriptional regulator
MSGLSVLTLLVAIFYTRRIKEANKKYEKAKDVIDDIIISFNRQMKKNENQTEVITRKLNVLSRQGETFTETLEKQQQQLQELKTLSKRILPSSHNQEQLKRLKSLEKRIDEFSNIKSELIQRISEVEKQKPQQKETDTRIAAAIPIKREKALAPLTETELAVLELIASEGEKTTPEIKSHVNLSREHTARLMKKLYEKGYLERSANKIPFKYYLKEEMRKILKKIEQKS